MGRNWKSKYSDTSSESGWTTVETGRNSLDFLRNNQNDEAPLWLGFDWHSVHRPTHVKNHEDEWGIDLALIPAGITDAYQPLDGMPLGL
jgi:hypothetical protein